MLVNSPLADPALQTQKAEIRHSINRLTIEYFKGTYTIQPNAPEGPTLLFTYPFTQTTIYNYMTNNLITRRIRYMLLIGILLSAFSAMKASTLPASVDSLQTLLKNDTDARQRAIIYIHLADIYVDSINIAPVYWDKALTGSRQSQRRIYDETCTGYAHTAILS